jgi:REP element-mobilizing transposase RayT
MRWLLSWTVHSAWFEGPARGWIERGCQGVSDVVPEPAVPLAAERAADLKWQAVRLDADQRRVVVDDLRRVAALRSFDPCEIVVAPDHVHVLLDCDPDRDMHRLVQLTKGALSRALSVLAGDPSARSRGGQPLPFQKWWSRQYSLLEVAEPETQQSVARQLEHCASAPDRTCWP